MYKGIVKTISSIFIIAIFLAPFSLFASENNQIYGEFVGDDFIISECEPYLPSIATSTNMRFTLPQLETYTPATFPSWAEVESGGYGGWTTSLEEIDACNTVSGYGSDNFLTAFGGTATNGTFFLWWYDTYKQPIGYTRIEYDTGTSTTPLGENFSTLTRIITTMPGGGETVGTTTTETVGATGWLNVDDYLSTDNDFKLKVSFNHQGIAQAGASPNVGTTEYEFDLFPADFNLSEEHQFENLGVYNMTVEIVEERLLWFDKVWTATSTTFIVGEKTGYDLLLEKPEEVFNFDLSTLDCAFDWTTGFDLGKCLLSLAWGIIYPSDSQITALSTKLEEVFLIKFPFGYVTRMIDIFTSEETQELPVIAFTMPSAIPAFGGMEFGINPTERLAEANAFIESIETEDYESVEDVFSLTVNSIIALMCILIIYNDLLHSGSSRGGGESHQEKQ